MAESPVLGLWRAMGSASGQPWCHSPEHRARPTHQALVTAAPGHQPLAEAVTADRVTLAAIGHRATGVTPTPCTQTAVCGGARHRWVTPCPNTYAGSPAGWQH